MPRPRPRAKAASASAWRSASTSVAPAPWKARARAWPSPPAAPVTSTRWPLKLGPSVMASPDLDVAEPAQVKTPARIDRDHAAAELVERQRTGGDVGIDDRPGAQGGPALAHQLEDVVLGSAEPRRVFRAEPADAVPAVAPGGIKRLRAFRY